MQFEWHHLNVDTWITSSELRRSNNVMFMTSLNSIVNLHHRLKRTACKLIVVYWLRGTIDGRHQPIMPEELMMNSIDSRNFVCQISYEMDGLRCFRRWSQPHAVVIIFVEPRPDKITKFGAFCITGVKPSSGRQVLLKITSRVSVPKHLILF